jgi:hypothetical protein
MRGGVRFVRTQTWTHPMPEPITLREAPALLRRAPGPYLTQRAADALADMLDGGGPDYNGGLLGLHGHVGIGHSAMVDGWRSL